MRPTPSVAVGAASGAVTVLVFTLVHGLWIIDIWDMVGQMLFAGILCGICLVWSYRAAVSAPSTRAWLVYGSTCTALVAVLGFASLAILEPRFTMAEMMVVDDAMAVLVPPSLPLMGGAAVLGTVVLWLWSGRRSRALLPLLVTQVLLVFFAGHQLAFLGLVDMPDGQVVATMGAFVGLVMLLGGLFTGGVLIGEALRTRLLATTGKDPAIEP